MIAKPIMPARERPFRKRQSSVRAIVLASLLSLGACVTPVAPTISADGDYRGSTTRFQVLRRTCPRPGLLRLSIRNATLFYPWAGQFIQVSILNNGTVSGSLPGVQLSGTHDTTIIQGDVTDGQCGLHFTLTRLEN
jgi:hypothetical protein